MSSSDLEGRHLSVPGPLHRYDLIDHARALPEPIALIGNGDIPAGCGEQVDACPSVVRFNRFRIQGYEDRVGTRTTHWCVNRSRAMHREMAVIVKRMASNQVIDILIARPMSFRSASHQRIYGPILDCGLPVHTLRREEWQLPEICNHQLTTGFMLAYLLGGIGKAVQLFGYDGLKSGHYFNNDHQHRLSHGVAPREIDLLAALESVEFMT